jgi:homogentisate 1,2-dioxygenase
MSVQLSDSREYQNIFHWAETQKDGTIPSFAVRKNDPYEVVMQPSRYALFKR